MKKQPLLAALIFALSSQLSACSGCTPAPIGDGDGDTSVGDGDGDTVGDGDGDGDAGDGDGDTDGGATADGGDGDGDTVGDGDGDDALGCTIYQEVCDDACTNVTVDPNNCGGCGVTCTGDEACVAGECGTECLGSQVICDNTCVDLDYDNDHCGECGTACPEGQGCSGGECVDTVDVGPGPAVCPPSGPIIPIGGTTDPDLGACGGDLAQTTFRWGLCSCTDLSTSGDVAVDAYDSLVGAYAPGGLGGGLGVNNDIGASGSFDVSGSMWNAGEGGLTTSGRIDVGLELRVGGDLTSSNAGSVGQDAYVGGDVAVFDYTIGGDLHVPAGSGVNGATYANLVEEPVDVALPCDCSDEQRIPVQDIVAAAAIENDNDVIGLDPDALDAPLAPIRLELPCGSYYLSEIGSSQPITVVATGRTALYIGGDVGGSADLTFSIAPGGELDVFIAGTFSSSGAVTLGSPAYPALMRVYLGAEEGVGLSSSLEVGAFLYAADGAVQSSGDIEIFGGVIAGDYGASGDTTVHYDGAVLSAGESCPPPGGTVVAPPDENDAGVIDDGGVSGVDAGAAPEPECGDCTDCGNQACNDGVCGACVTSDDCCAPLQCFDGTCLLVGG